jgi:tRNA-specific 2-thiouridylase
MKFWAADYDKGENRCCSTESEQRARKTALLLGIPFYVFDLREEFKKLIVDRFIGDIKKGLTPNPCVICNEKIKFGLLIKRADELGAQFIATGHYAQIKKTKGIYKLLKGKDKNKDQSYFLWRLNQKQLSRIIFPAGCFEKSEVRSLAKKWKLPSAQTPESQEVCFAPKGLEDFVLERIGRNPGDIIDASGKILGRHEGLWPYTIGQRKGIRLSGGPYYVVAKDMHSNRLIVSKDKADLQKREAVLRGANWTSGIKPGFPLKARVKIRYRGKEVVAEIAEKGFFLVLKFARHQDAVTPGQSAVLYRGDELLGGGEISFQRQGMC